MVATARETGRFGVLRHAALCLVIFTGASGNDLLSAPAPPPADPDALDCARALGDLQPLRVAELDTELEVLSWNIQKAGSAGWADDLASFAEGVHLAFIQEAPAGIGSLLAAPYRSFAAGYHTGDMQTGVMTLSRGMPSLRCGLSHLEPWLGTPKATSVTEYALRGRDDRLLAINLHAVNFSLGVKDFQAQIHALDDLLERHRGPVVLAGDLNTWSERRQALVDDFLSGHGLSEVRFSQDLRTTAFGHALDHIYVRGMVSELARVIPVRSSDHNPLRVRLRVR